MNSSGNDLYRVGDWLVDAAGDRLSRDGVEVRIEPKTMAVLHYLARRPQEVVSADQLIEAVWQGRPLGDSPVYKCIAHLRKALGDDSRSPDYIENIPRKGYRLIAPVTPAESVAQPPQPDAQSSVRLPTGARKPLVLLGLPLAIFVVAWLVFRSAQDAAISGLAPPVIAVLPFTDMSAARDQAYFAEGVAEEVLNALAQVPSLRVIARSSSFALGGPAVDIAAIAEKLQATHILEGSVRKSGSRIRVTAQLIDAVDRLHLWSETYDASLGDVLAVQYQIASQIAEELHPLLSVPSWREGEGPGAIIPAAYEHYLKGRYYLQQFRDEPARKAKEHFELALDADPGFALAWAGLADAYKTLDYFAVLAPEEAAQRGRAAAERALVFDPGLAEAHAALGTVLTDYYYEWELAEHHFRQAIERNPSYATGYQLYAEYLRDMGRFDEALAMISQAQLLDPLSAFHRLVEGIILDLSGHPAEAIEQYQRLLELQPRYQMTHFYVGLARMQLGQYEAALASFAAADPEGNLPDAVAARAATLAALGRVEDARDALAELDRLSDVRYVSPFLRAIVYLELGDRDRALDLLEATYTERSWFVRLFGILPGLDRLRDDPRFEALLQRTGLAEVVVSNPAD